MSLKVWDWICRWHKKESSSNFSSTSTAEQVTQGIDTSNLTAIVTGATSGIGEETARVLALRGATVIIPARKLESGLKVKQSILDENPKAKLDVMELDLSSINSVTSFANSFNSSNHSLNILINNAGIMACPFQLSKDGIELQFTTNHLGHFLLTKLLMDKIKATAKRSGIEGRIVNVSSSAHRRVYKGGILFDRINDPTCYAAYGAYGQSKLANVLHANELSRRLREEGTNVTANSLHPGVIPTNIARYMPFISNEQYMKFMAIPLTLVKLFLKTVPQGAATTCYLALHPNPKGVSGKYFSNCNEDRPTALATDVDLAKRLWEFSEELIESKKNKSN